MKFILHVNSHRLYRIKRISIYWVWKSSQKNLAWFTTRIHDDPMPWIHKNSNSFFGCASSLQYPNSKSEFNNWLTMYLEFQEAQDSIDKKQWELQHLLQFCMLLFLHVWLRGISLNQFQKWRSTFQSLVVAIIIIKKVVYIKIPIIIPPHFLLYNNDLIFQDSTSKSSNTFYHTEPLTVRTQLRYPKPYGMWKGKHVWNTDDYKCLTTFKTKDSNLLQHIQ